MQILCYFFFIICLFPLDIFFQSYNYARMSMSHKRLTQLQPSSPGKPTRNKQQATSNKQQATSNKQQATSNKQQAHYYVAALRLCQAPHRVHSPLFTFSSLPV
jgi:hypothetical protein